MMDVLTYALSKKNKTTKLSDLENDLFYSKCTPFLTITEKDCEPIYNVQNSDEVVGYQYVGSPKLDWLKSLDDIYVRGELSYDPDGTGTNIKRFIFNQTMLRDIGNGMINYKYIEEMDLTVIQYLVGVGICNGINYLTYEVFDGFTIIVFGDTKFTLEIFRVEEKSIPTKQIVDWEECHSDAPGFISNKPFGIVCEPSELFSFIELEDESTAVPETLDPFNAETEYFSYIGDVRYPVEVKSAEDGTTYLEIVVDDSSTVQIYTDRIVGPVGLQVSLGCYNKTMLELDPKYVPSKMNVENPVGTGSFSMNRKEGTVIGGNSHTEGSSTTASGDASHAEGSDTIASGGSSHAEGSDTKATQAFSHAEGKITTASGIASHTEGANTKAAGDYSHAEGFNTEASGRFSHAEGYGTKALSNNQHVQGKCNVSDSDSKYAHIVGNGDSNSARSNAHTLGWDGTGWFAGDVFIGGTGQDDTNAKKLATEEYVTNSLPNKLPNPSVMTIKQGDTEVSYDGSGAVTVTIPESSDGKSAYQYAVEGGYTGTETEFAAKLAEEMPDKLPNPYALTINGTSYDGSNAVNVTVTGESGGNGWSKVAEFEYNLNDELIVDSFTSENKYLHFTTAHGLAVGDYLLIREPHIIKTSKCGYTTVTDIIDENTVVCDSITNTSDFSGNFIVEKSAGRVLFNYSGLITKPFARMRISGTTIFLSGKNWTYSTYYQNYGADCLMGEFDNTVTSGNSIVAIKGLPYCGQMAINTKRYNGSMYIIEEDGVYSISYTRYYSPIPEKHVYTPQLVFNGLRIIVEEADEWDIP